MSNKESAYIYTRPDVVSFSIPCSDNSGEKLSVTTSRTMTDVLIKDGSHTILVDMENIDWLLQALDDVKKIAEMKSSLPPPIPNQPQQP